MIEIASKEAPHFENSLHTPGGFVWWYADLVNGEGDGCVLVWSFGLPFLPGSRDGGVARSLPALHFAFYKGGQEQFYLLNRHPERDAAVDVDTGSAQIGKSKITLVEEGEEVRLSASVDEPLSSTSKRLRVDLKVSGPRFRVDASTSESRHVWCPRSVDAQGSARFSCEDADEQLFGSAYIDSNASLQALHEQELSSWRWGRVVFPDGTLVFYDVEADNGATDALAFFQDHAGNRWEGLRLRFGGARQGSYGIFSPRTLQVEGAGRRYIVKYEHLVDDGPFYQRFLLSATGSKGQTGSGMGEYVLPAMVDLPWQRPLVRMKTFDVGRKNSMWLPFFTGNRRSRTGRMLHKAFFNWGDT